MELDQIRLWFDKLLDALRMDSEGGPHDRVDVVGERVVRSFEVKSDGLLIRGRIIFPVSKPAKLYPVVILCHGIPGSGAPRPADDPGYEGLAEELGSMGLASVIFNFRGCGDSEGNFEMMGWVRDLDAVLRKVRQTPYVDPDRILIVGFSGGGAAAVKVASDSSDIFGLAVVGTPAHFEIFEKDASEIIEDFRERGIIRDADFPPNVDRWMEEFREVEPRRWVPFFKGKYLLVVHGDEDDLVPVDHAHQLKDKAPAGVAELVIIPGGEHRLRLDPRCLDAIKSWINRIFGWKSEK